MAGQISNDARENALSEFYGKKMKSTNESARTK